MKEKTKTERLAEANTLIDSVILEEENILVKHCLSGCMESITDCICRLKKMEGEQMRFLIQNAWENGERVLNEYGCLKKYNAIIKGDDLFITINSLQDLIDIIKATDNCLIVENGKIIIYDDYIE